MSTPPNSGIIFSTTAYGSPPRPQTNSSDALQCWLKNVARVAPWASQEDLETYSELVNSIPESNVDNSDVQTVIAIVKQVAATKIFNPELSDKVKSALQTLGFQKV